MSHRNTRFSLRKTSLATSRASSGSRKHRKHGSIRHSPPRPALMLVGGITYLGSAEVSKQAYSLGASAREAAMLSAIFEMEGFGGREFERALTSRDLVASELSRIRLPNGR